MNIDMDMDMDQFLLIISELMDFWIESKLRHLTIIRSIHLVSRSRID